MKRGLKLFSVLLAMVMSIGLCMGGLSIETLSASDGDYDYSSEPNESWYYYEIEVLKEVEILPDGLTEHGGRNYDNGTELYFEAFALESVDGDGTLLAAIDESNIMELERNELSKSQTLVFASPEPLKAIGLLEESAVYPPYGWTDSWAAYYFEFESVSKQKPGTANSTKLSKMYQLCEDNGDEIDNPKLSAVKFVNQFTVSEEDLYEYEFDITIEVEQKGNVAPGEKDFVFEIFYEEPSYEMLSLDEIPGLASFKTKPVTVNGAGVHNVTVTFYSPMWLDMLGIRLADDGAANWEYDTTEYLMRYSNYNAIESDEYMIGVYDSELGEYVETDELYFHNVYTRNSAPAPIVEEDTYTITAKAGNHGEISPEGEVEVEEGRNKTFVFDPDKGYEVSKIVIDGKELSKKRLAEVKLDGEYTFYDVDEDHTIKVSFSKIEEEAKEIPVENAVEEINPNTGAI